MSSNSLNTIEADHEEQVTVEVILREDQQQQQTEQPSQEQANQDDQKVKKRDPRSTETHTFSSKWNRYPWRFRRRSTLELEEKERQERAEHIQAILEERSHEGLPFSFYSSHFSSQQHHPNADQHSLGHGIQPHTLRERIGFALESKWTHLIILGLILLDFFIILAEIIISLYQDCAPLAGHSQHHHAPWVHPVEEVLRWVTVAILSVFVIENTLKLVIFGPKYFTKHFFHALDYIIVTISLVMTITMHGIASELIGLLVLLRFWRVVRLMDVIVISLNLKHHKEKHALKHRLEELELKCVSLEKLVVHLSQDTTSKSDSTGRRSI